MGRTMGRASLVMALLVAACNESWVGPALAQPPKTAEPKGQPPKKEEIDFDRARELLRKRNNGLKLTADEEAYLRRAIEARNGGPGGAGGPLQPKEKTGLKPLSEMSAADRYKGEDGGLYGEGKNEPPDGHRRAALAELERIRPLNADGKPDDTGRIVFVSISMSNATQEFSRFKQLADADRAKSAKLTIVDCAQGGQAMAEWVRSDAPPWREAERRIQRADVSAKQVQVAWVKIANKGPTGDLPVHGKKLQADTTAVITEAKNRFPNLRIVYLSSRIYGGYATGALNPEPYAYEGAFVARRLIRDQIAGAAELNNNPDRGAVKVPLLLWGPYLWADGMTPRTADKLHYTRDDLARDGTHPSEAGRTKVAELMLNFYKTDPLAKGWFTAR